MPYLFKNINDIERGTLTRALVRVDFNVPIKDGIVQDGFRIDETWPTLKVLLKKGFKLVLLAHLGEDGSESLRPIVQYMAKFSRVVLASSIEEAKILTKDGNNIVLLENVRGFPGEKENSSTLSKSFASLGDIFVNEGFSVSHRKHSSVVGVAKYLPSYAGVLFKKEVEMLSKAFNPTKPFVLILGGKKAETKIPLISRFVDNADKIILGGALANDFLKAKGFNVGKSLISDADLIKKDWLADTKFVTPEKVIVEGSNGGREILTAEMGEGDKIVDVGESFVEIVRSILKSAKFVVWNGSFGICESGYDSGTKGIAEAVVSSGAFSVVGGGDTTAALDSFKMADKFSFVSTGGGAMLDFLAVGTLPGIEALSL
ncbi:MAG: phosphoglycerate kinase [Candidatus Taylorbacteria bacterium RIFCSPLOWO2_02_FULL_43_11]|uniref:Phosphoglycerate kinase n=1 Tax=Candidatus Taylorbacteria bacterium RIFCSPHIGHO2_02_FULL_43_32b TaxID=1802306 RepID=A0A1G2MGE8_9BACT|nr:MAG: phosphoglycerate kinase [Candidatus Taylorbacteria bacterium RIFCSPHIGHO2_01_FULL_43_47]OHA22980.1 MAG: phosphoglycerate kinase [Candidatus Taylorbacteria bacterium RIFCSPHIGHO2_02_FULL_43_32b]OHA29893.1 MAG: phosphoglycerate kinase [Candidatus Taylorbacteria bacterium RIFCSPLOWO2_01_FULL_43_44]OHA36166.1 MAG: phosphoglycerate kinase [Candidatus Taylorbacteria bacterium RIFCSPLOWO2_02_FULL_43_11]